MNTSFFSHSRSFHIIIRLTAICGTLFAFSFRTHGVVVFDSFGTSPPNLDNGGDALAIYVGLSFLDPPPNTRTAAAFTVSGDSDISLESVSLALNTHFGNYEDNLKVTVASNNAGVPSDTALDTMFGSLPASGSSVITLNSTSNPVLTKGETYWLIAEPVEITGDELFAGWIANQANIEGSALFDESVHPNAFTGNWQTSTFSLPAFQVEGSLTAVPEPATYAVITGCGLLGFAAYRRRLNNL